MKKDLPPYTTRDRRGTIYFRRRGQPQVKMACQEPGTPAFAAEYARLLNGLDATPTTRRTLAALIDSYVRSDRYRRLAPRTGRDYDQHLAFLRDKLGDVAVKDIARPVVIRLRDSDSRPHRGNYCTAVFRVVLEHAVDLGWIASNPAKGVGARRYEKQERQPWPADLIAAYRAKATGKAALAFELLLGTGQRVGDVLAMRWSDVQDGGVWVKQSKTATKLWIPLTPALRAALVAAPRAGLTILTNHRGGPWSYRSASQAIRQVREQIGAEAYDIHALRYTAASEIAAAGGSDDEIEAITGHKARAMVVKYAGAARQKQRATQAQKRRT